MEKAALTVFGAIRFVLGCCLHTDGKDYGISGTTCPLEGQSATYRPTCGSLETFGGCRRVILGLLVLLKPTLFTSYSCSVSVSMPASRSCLGFYQRTLERLLRDLSLSLNPRVEGNAGWPWHVGQRYFDRCDDPVWAYD